MVHQLLGSPLRFERNVGQAGAGVEFLARGAGYAALVNATSLTLRFGGVFQMRLEGANPAAKAELVEPLNSPSHYLRGQTWHTDVPTYARLVYHQVYPGIDVAYYGNPSRLEYDFIVAPGSDPSAIRVSFAPREAVTVSADGDLIVQTPGGELRQLHPRLYQRSFEGDTEVHGAYVSTGPAEIGFLVETYDHNKPLIIDPTLTYSSYLGGSADDSVSAIALDASGNIYLAGWTDSVDFPMEDAFQSSNRGGVEAFVVKLNPAGTALLYSTYLGGTYSDRAAGLAVDSSGCAVVTGSTQSSGFPTLNAFQATLHGTSDAFVTKLNAAGNGLIFSTFLGGSSQESGNGVALDTAGNIYVTGSTSSADFPRLNAYQAANHGTQNAFLVKLSSTGSLIYGTYLGGSLTDSGNGVAVDSFGNAYITGGTTSLNFPVVGGVQAHNAGGQDAFVAKFNTTGSSLVYSTYLGGSGGTTMQPETGNAIAVDSIGDAYVTGTTSSIDFPLVNPFQAGLAGSSDAFVTELNSSGSAIAYSSYLGGSSVDYGNAIAVSPSGAAYIAGYTASTDFPVVDAIQEANAGSYDAFVAVVAPGGASMLFSTYLGGASSDAANAIAIDTLGNICLAGQTLSYGFPTVAPLEAANPGGYGGFVAKIQISTLSPPSVVIDSPTAGASVSGTITVVGWAIDNTAAVGTAIGNVQVLVDGNPVGTATYGISRTDVCTAYPGRAGCPNVGYSYQLNTGTLTPGSHTITVSATNSDAIPLTGSVNTTVNLSASVGPPSVVIDSPTAGASVSGTITVVGWTIDNKAAVGTAINTIQVLVDGNAVGSATYGISRPDVCTAYPNRPGCPNVGYSYQLNTGTLTPGSHTITVSATNSDATPLTGSANVAVTAGAPTGPPSVVIDSPSAGASVSGTFTVVGWAIDNTAAVGTAIKTVQVLVDGTSVGTATYGLSRPDVCTAYPGRAGCPNVGYSYQLNTGTVTPGSHTITVSATNSDATPLTGSASVAVTVGASAAPPSVVIDSPTAGASVSGTITVVGWAIDNKVAVGTAINTMQVLVDGTAVGTATYGLSRPDVCTAYPGRPGCPNVGYFFQLNTATLTPGSHTITVTATNSDATPLTGSANVAVNVPTGPPSVVIDSPTAGASVSGTITVVGWAIDNNVAVGTAINTMQVLVDGTAVGTATYGLSRPDVCSAYPGRPGCPSVGYYFQLNTGTLAPGSHNITVTATDSDTTPDTGSQTVSITVN